MSGHLARIVFVFLGQTDVWIWLEMFNVLLMLLSAFFLDQQDIGPANADYANPRTLSTFTNQSFCWVSFLKCYVYCVNMFLVYLCPNYCIFYGWCHGKNVYLTHNLYWTIACRPTSCIISVFFFFTLYSVCPFHNSQSAFLLKNVCCVISIYLLMHKLRCEPIHISFLQYMSSVLNTSSW